MKSIIRKFKAKEGWIYNVYMHIDRVSDRMEEHHLYMLAAGIAYNILIYMIPLLLLVIFTLGLIFDTETITKTLENLLTDYLPQTGTSQEIGHTIVGEIEKIFTHSTLVGWIGIIGLLWVSSILISSIRSSLNAIFDLASPKIFILYRLKDMLLTIVFSILFLVYAYAIPLVNFILGFMGDYLPDIISSLLSDLVLTSVSVGTSFVLFYLIFRFVPNERLPRFVRIWSTLICVFGIEFARFLFGWYIVSLSNYGRFYGTYAVLISMALWIYYSALIILLAAEVSKYIHERRILAKAIKEADISEPSK
ncbi:MAG: YihY/virulence factor BrkB family protein [Candidatus Kapabacteria bacterium]|nr:YihY/virulence factor BrkB family protein [Candidatus Kapabacteria bacterium]